MAIKYSLLLLAGLAFFQATDKVKAASIDIRDDKESYSWTNFHDLSTTYNWLHSLAKTFPNKVTIFKAGETYENRKILGLKISDGKQKKAIFIEGGSRPLEWISPATVTYITNQLLTSKDPEVRSIVKNYDWYIVPITNPDGYEYTHTTDRFWRKTRSIHGNCIGVDLNSNWGFHWGEGAVSNNPCSNTYNGPSAFSEIEAKSLSKFLMTLKDRLFLHLSFNANNQWLFFPYGVANISNPKYETLKRVCDAAIAGAARRFGTEYTGGSLAEVLYPMSGTSMDWAYGVLGADYAFNYQLPPPVKVLGPLKSNYDISPKKIIPIGEETLDSVLELIKSANN